MIGHTGRYWLRSNFYEVVTSLERFEHFAGSFLSKYTAHMGVHITGGCTAHITGYCQTLQCCHMSGEVNPGNPALPKWSIVCATKR